VESRLLLDVVVGESAAVLELLAREDQALLVRGNALLVLNLGLDIVCPSSACFLRFLIIVSDGHGCAGARALRRILRTDRVRGLDLKGDGLARPVSRLAM
jgi:hypothetical protein